MYVQWGQNLYEVSFQLKWVPYFAMSTKADPIYAIFHNFSLKWGNSRQLEITTVPSAWILKNAGFFKVASGNKWIYVAP